MSDSKETLREIWKDLDAQRAFGRPNVSASLLRLARGEIPGDLTFEVVESALNFGSPDRADGYQVTPTVVIDLMAALASRHKAQTILDPMSNAGLLAAGVKSANREARIDVFEVDRDKHEIAKALLTGATVTLGRPIDGLEVPVGAYDAILCDPPLGARPIKNVGGSHLKAARDLAQQILIWACDQLTDSGVAAIAMTSAALTNKQMISAINNAGCRLRAVFHIPAGMRSGTTIASEVLVVEHGDQERVFIGQVSGDSAQLDLLLRNYQRKKDGPHASLGRMRSVAGLLAFDAIEAGDRLREKLRGQSVNRIKFAELVVATSNVALSDEYQSAEAPPDNSIFLAQPIGRFFPDLQSIPPKSRTCKRLELDPNRALSQYLVHWFANSTGRLALRAASVGSALGANRITSSTLDALEVFLPAIEAQRVTLRAAQHLEVLKNEVAESELSLWDERESAADCLARIEQINHEDRFEDWVESLPFPIASILWRHHIEEGDARIKVGILLHFFEALAAFLGTVHMSALSTSDVAWPALHSKLNTALYKQRLSFERATFGTWRVALEILSFFTRKQLSEEPNRDVMSRLYASASSDWVSRLADSRLVSVLSEANGIRNSTTGHGGAMSADAAADIEGKLLDLARDVRGVFGTGWANYELIQGGPAEFDENEFCSRAPLLMGTRTEFRRTERTTEHPLKKERLYLMSPGSSRALELIPFIRLAPSPRSKVNACYFFSRLKGDLQEFVSYHFAEEAEMDGEFADTAAALRRLSEPELPTELS